MGGTWEDPVFIQGKFVRVSMDGSCCEEETAKKTVR